ncbi:carboxypeptidase-like regulatory domain-containing protein [Nocardioides daeguensis]|uniref:Alpha-amylase n=1 Tax=Nocardioides daeguensis TaxID=908359 RepID=A0ABP6WNX8_9ACTN|nr:carboxypeptidase-like regulatory domain-containing protein [Nocardioides daeguensis]MBV6726571.1 carboxypeptidase-like regulatory domain-containing protein [Nocardioides daeguensis]MCR1772414.1 carboxypeptidase-like regulatory domain-containing protein [Nocardioides daeguensis]
MRTHARGPVVRLLTAVLTTALALVGLVALTTATAPVAQAATTGISGKVTAAGAGTPLAGMTVVLYCNEDGDWYWCQDTTSGTGGAYAFDTLPASLGGSYHVGAFSDDNRYAATFVGGTDEVNATGIEPPATDVDLAMQPNAAITGKATQGLLATGVAGVDVCLYQQFADEDWSGWYCVNETTTAANGSYTLWAEPGTYRVGFSTADNHLREVYYANAASVENATDLVVGASGRSQVNAKLVPNAKVTGKVSVTDSATGIGGAQVTAYQLVQDGADSSWEPGHAATADGTGSYELYLAPGAYRIGFEGPCSADGECSQEYRAEFWDDKATVEAANDVTVGNSGAVGNVNAALTRNPRVTGTVTEQDGGAPIAGARVRALQQVTEVYDGETFTYWDQVASASADATGAYALPAPPGTYRLSFDEGCAEWPCADIFQTEYWQEAATLETGKDVTLGGTLTLPGRNGTLAKNGKITGTVTAEDGGAPIADVQVVVFDEETEDGETYWSPVGFATTDETGKYTLHAAPGSHRVGFFELCSGADCRYLPEFYDDAATPDAGTAVAVAGPDTTTPDIDAALAEGSLITGTLTDNADVPVADASVSVYAEDGGDWTPVDGTWSDEDGSYAVLVPDGSFRVGFSSWDGAFTDEYYDDSLTLAGADTVVVAGADQTHIDAELGLTLVNAEAPTIPDADPKVGETITADTGTWSATPDAFTYRWFQSGTTDPIGTDQDLVVPAGALGKQLTLEVTATKAGYADGVATSLPSAAVAQGVLTSTAKPTVSGAVAVGSTVTALEGTWSATPDAYTYEWFQAGTATPIGTSRTLVVPAGAVGKTLSVKVTATKAGHTSGVATSDPTAAVTPAGLANTVKPTISGDLVVGGTVSAVEGTWSDTPDSYTYRWFQAGTAEPIGTGEQLEIPTSAWGKTLTVEVTAVKLGHHDSTATSDPSAAVDAGSFATPPTPAITGEAKVGATLTAVEGAWSPTPGTYAYQWYQAGTTEPIGTTKNLVVPVGALGKKLTVKVTGVKVGYQVASATSEPTAAVAPGDLANTAAPSITGEVKVAKTVTAGNGTWSVTPDSYTYRWFQAGTATPIGTGKELVVPAGAAGKLLTVEVTAKAAGYEDGVAGSAPSGAVALGDLVNTAPPTVVGTAQVGRTVTADPGTWTPAPAPDGFTYVWFRADSDDPIGTGKELVVPAAADGKKLWVTVTASVPGYAESSADSEHTGAVIPPATQAFTVRPSLTGTARVGETVTAQDGTWTDKPDRFTYRWFQFGSTTPIGTGKTLVVPPGAVGWALVVEVTAHKAGYADRAVLTVPTAPVAAGKLKVSGTVSLAGKAKVGKRLKVVLPTVVPAGATVTVQWLVGKKPVPGATKKTLKLDTALYRGTKVRAVVAWTLPGYTTVVLKTAKVRIK